MEWRKLLLEQPYLADRCAQVKGCKRFFPDKAKECASGWAAILLENLKLVGEFAEWGYSNKKALCDFLSCNSNSQFIDWCDNANIWTKFDFKEWRKLLSKQPQFADRLDKLNGWNKFNSWDWDKLLFYQPQFADRCDKVNGWAKFDSRVWCTLLLKYPQFADRCDKVNGWAKFDSRHLDCLLWNQPQLADRRKNQSK